MTRGRRQRFLLVPEGQDQPGEVDRLVALGAVRVDVDPSGAVLLADPDGSEFLLLPR